MSKSVAIVTGASQGIGRATAICLARDFSALVRRVDVVPCFTRRTLDDRLDAAHGRWRGEIDLNQVEASAPRGSRAGRLSSGKGDHHAGTF